MDKSRLSPPAADLRAADWSGLQTAEKWMPTEIGSGTARMLSAHLWAYLPRCLHIRIALPHFIRSRLAPLAFMEQGQRRTRQASGASDPAAAQDGHPSLQPSDDGTSARTAIEDREGGHLGPSEAHDVEARLPKEKAELYEVVSWDGDDDPANPLNKSSSRKWFILCILGSATMCVTCASSMTAATYIGLERDFGVSREVATLSLSL